jgi:signal transduction histidine kinase
VVTALARSEPLFRVDHAARRLTAAVGAVGAIVCAFSVALVVSNVPADEAVARGTTAGLVTGIPVATGLYALRVRQNARFGFALILAGFMWSATALGEATESLPYSIGRLAAWCVFPSVIFLMLAFPDGRLTTGLDRALFLALNAVLLVLYIGSALFVEAFPAHTPWASCIDDCPANAFLILDHEPAVMNSVVQPVRELAASGLFAAVVVAMLLRYRRATPLRRRTLLPVLITSGFSVALLGAFFVTRRQPAHTELAEALGLLWGLCIAGIALAFFSGLLRRRLMIGEVLARLTDRLGEDADVPRLRDALAEALSDPTLEVLVPDGPVRWRDSAGRAGGMPGPGDDRAATIVYDEHGAAAVALVHDPELRQDAELLTAVSALVRATVRHHGVTTRLATTLRQLEQSRRRIAEAADSERARIERDLHDGAQQRLMMLRIRLSLAEELLRDDPAAGAAAVHELGAEAERTLEELRSLAHGVYPAILHDRGIEQALRSLAIESPLPVHLQTRRLTRLPMEIETAVYFTCLEAVQNAIKHAPTASGIWITVNNADVLTFEVRDDGPGFTPVHGEGRSRTDGLRNMRDRLEAVGGRLTIDTAPGHGTRVIGSVPTPR